MGDQLCHSCRLQSTERQSSAMAAAVAAAAAAAAEAHAVL